jgi:ferritin-like metal-binding protein YciE
MAMVPPGRGTRSTDPKNQFPWDLLDEFTARPGPIVRQRLETPLPPEERAPHASLQQLTEALPEMVKAANSPQLREAFASHLKETEQHFEKVHQILQNLDENPGTTKCQGMEGLLDEGEDAIDEEASPAVRDAFLIAAAQRVEHYEISGYGTARAHARSLGREEDAKVLNQILDQEYAADNKLDKLAEGHINDAAKRG